ncbi:hypothetical protein PAXINDRAFT_153249 [Paxillus involutus ATCC 200175]|nr:hypothetical protein PAXINDRAFT_153249 [Paxillus involutus ATCC 200175]
MNTNTATTPLPPTVTPAHLPPPAEQPEGHSTTTTPSAPITTPTLANMPGAPANTAEPTNCRHILGWLLVLVVLVFSLMVTLGSQCPVIQPTGFLPLLACAASASVTSSLAIIVGVYMGNQAANTLHLLICGIFVCSGAWLLDLPLRLAMQSLLIYLQEELGLGPIPILVVFLVPHFVWLGWWSTALWLFYTDTATTPPLQLFKWFCNTLCGILPSNMQPAPTATPAHLPTAAERPMGNSTTTTPSVSTPALSANTTEPINHRQLLTNLFILGVVLVDMALLLLTGIHCPLNLAPTQSIQLLICTTSSFGGWLVGIVGGMCMGDQAFDLQHLIICTISVLCGVWLSDLPLRLVFLSSIVDQFTSLVSIPLWEGPGSTLTPILLMWWFISLWNLYAKMTGATLHPPRLFEWFCNAFCSIIPTII